VSSTRLQPCHDPKFRLPPEIEERTLGADKYPLWAGPRGWQTACHNLTVINAILTGKPYPVRAVYVSGANIVVTYPNTPKTVDALRSLDFLMVSSDARRRPRNWQISYCRKQPRSKKMRFAFSPAVLLSP
jgi:anaerobic selenocysteine-containing dehydrogenase